MRKNCSRKAILFDGHNDLPWAIRQLKDAPGDVDAYDIREHAPAGGQTDIPRLREGGVGAVFWSVYTPGEAAGDFAKTQLEQIDIARRVIANYPDTFTLASTAADIRAAKAAGKIGGMLGAEGGHAIEDSLGAPAHVLRPRRALHDADAQQAPVLGRLRDGSFPGPRRAHASSASRSSSR